jgi:hypothetical protein
MSEAEREVRARFPLWDDWTVQKHLEQRRKLQEQCRQQERQKYHDALAFWAKPE